MRLACGDAVAAQSLVGKLAERPYLIEGDVDLLWRVCMMDATARVLLGQRSEIAQLMNQYRMLVRQRPWMALQLYSNFTPYLGLLAQESRGFGFLGRLLFSLASRSLSLRRSRGARVWSILLAAQRRLLDLAGAFTSLVLFFIAEPLFGRSAGSTGEPSQPTTSTLSAWMSRPRFGGVPAKGGVSPRKLRWSKEPLVTRAMGGIGDILMMSPGLRALAARRGHPVKFAIKRQFHPLFENNPYVELLDIEGPVVDVQRHRWYNLSNCPAAFHESLRRPFVRRGRVELFARGMGISRRRLERTGQKIDIFLSPEQRQFAESWVAERALGRKRPLVGVQPHSREAYRDHPRMYDLIARLAERYDVLVFHHLPLDLSRAPGAAHTAGLKLGQSLALVERLDAMVCVDSAFLHAAGAFDIPVVTLFGPIDGPLRVVHMQNATVLDARATFGCSPCWRNEDQPCLVTGQLGSSPCMAAIPIESVLDAVAAKLSTNPSGRSRMQAEPVNS